jgi:hypothetical protein
VSDGGFAFFAWGSSSAAPAASRLSEAMIALLCQMCSLTPVVPSLAHVVWRRAAALVSSCRKDSAPLLSPHATRCRDHRAPGARPHACVAPLLCVTAFGDDGALQRKHTAEQQSTSVRAAAPTCTAGLNRVPPQRTSTARDVQKHALHSPSSAVSKCAGPIERLCAVGTVLLLLCHCLLWPDGRDGWDWTARPICFRPSPFRPCSLLLLPACALLPLVSSMPLSFKCPRLCTETRAEQKRTRATQPTHFGRHTHRRASPTTHTQDCRWKRGTVGCVLVLFCCCAWFLSVLFACATKEPAVSEGVRV